MLTQRSDFVNDKKAHEHRMKELLAMMDFKANDPIIKHYKQAVDFALVMIDKVEAEINKIISKDEAMSKNFELITSIPGIGPANGWMTIAYTENFECFPDEELMVLISEWYHIITHLAQASRVKAE